MAGNTCAILHTASDVTDRQLAYQNVEEQQEKLILSRELDMLTNILAHDLKNPLAVLKNRE